MTDYDYEADRDITDKLEEMANILLSPLPMGAAFGSVLAKQAAREIRVLRLKVKMYRKVIDEMEREINDDRLQH